MARTQKELEANKKWRDAWGVGKRNVEQIQAQGRMNQSMQSQQAQAPQINYGFDQINDRRTQTKSNLYDISQMAQADRTAYTGYEERGKQQQLKNLDRQEAARKAHQASGGNYSDLSKYDLASAGSSILDWGDIKYLQKQGVSDDKIRNYINSYEGNIAESLRYNKNWGGDKYVGEFDKKNKKISDFDVGKRYNKTDINYLKSQGYTDQEIADDMISRTDKVLRGASAKFLNEQGRLEEWEKAKERAQSYQNNSTNNSNNNNNNTTNSNNISNSGNTIDSNNISNSGNTTDSNNMNDSFNSQDNNSLNDSYNNNDSFNSQTDNRVSDSMNTNNSFNSQDNNSLNDSYNNNDSFNSQTDNRVSDSMNTNNSFNSADDNSTKDSFNTNMQANTTDSNNKTDSYNNNDSFNTNISTDRSYNTNASTNNSNNKTNSDNTNYSNMFNKTNTNSNNYDNSSEFRDVNANIGKQGDINTNIQNSTFGAGANFGNDYSVTIGGQNFGNNGGQNSAGGTNAGLSNMQGAAAYSALNNNQWAQSGSQMNGYGRSAGAVQEANRMTNATGTAANIYNMAGMTQNYWNNKATAQQGFYLGDIFGNQQTAPWLQPPSPKKPEDKTEEIAKGLKF